MADNKIRKTSLQEARDNYEEIQSFAEEAVRKEMDEKIEAKKAEMLASNLEESVTIDANGTSVEIDDDGTVSINSSGAIETEDMPAEDSLEASEEDMPEEEMGLEPIEVSADEDPIEVENELEELYNEESMQEEYMEEQEPVAPAPAPAPAAEMPAEEMPVAGEEEVAIVDDPDTAVEGEGDAASQIAAGIEQMITDKVAELTGAEAGMEEMPAEEVPAEEVPAEPAAAAPAPAAEEPIAEMDEEIMEIVDEDFMAEDDMFEVVDEDMYEVMIPEMDDEFSPRDTALADMGDEYSDVLDMDDEYMGDELEEIKMMGAGHSVQRTTGDSAGPENAKARRSRERGKLNISEGKMKKEITEAANKAAEAIKAQYESTMDELKKENASLTKTNKSLNEEVANYENSFRDIRKQFDLLETFNAKLAFANQLYANGGFSKEEKMQIAESFDGVKSYSEAEALYNSILKENKVSVKKETSSKIKQAPTNTVKSTKEAAPLYESVEMKRMIQLAGIDKKVL